jgi:hypothetical protein
VDDKLNGEYGSLQNAKLLLNDDILDTNMKLSQIPGNEISLVLKLDGLTLIFEFQGDQEQIEVFEFDYLLSEVLDGNCPSEWLGKFDPSDVSLLFFYFKFIQIKFCTATYRRMTFQIQTLQIILFDKKRFCSLLLYQKKRNCYCTFVLNIFRQFFLTIWERFFFPLFFGQLF